MSARAWDLKITLIGTVLAIALTLIPRLHPFVVILFALPLVFVLPGYALVAALFPQKSLGGVETLTLSLGLSFAVTIAGGLVLNATAWGLTPIAWTIFLGGVTLGSVAVAWRRRAAATLARAFRFSLRAESVGACVLSALIVIGALMLASASAQNASAPFTQVWVQPTTRAALEIGVGNFETRAMTYRLRVEMDAQSVYEAEFTLAASETHVKWIELDAQDVELRARLYRADAPLEVYREVVWRARVANE